MIFRKKAPLVGDRQEFAASIELLEDAYKHLNSTLEDRKALLKNFHRRLDAWQKEPKKNR